MVRFASCPRATSQSCPGIRSVEQGPIEWACGDTMFNRHRLALHTVDYWSFHINNHYKTMCVVRIGFYNPHLQRQIWTIIPVHCQTQLASFDKQSRLNINQCLYFSTSLYSCSMLLLVLVQQNLNLTCSDAPISGSKIVFVNAYLPTSTHFFTTYFTSVLQIQIWIIICKLWQIAMQ